MNKKARASTIECGAPAVAPAPRCYLSCDPSGEIERYFFNVWDGYELKRAEISAEQYADIIAEKRKD